MLGDSYLQRLRALRAQSVAGTLAPVDYELERRRLVDHATGTYFSLSQTEAPSSAECSDVFDSDFTAAASSNNLGQLKLLVRQGASVNSRDPLTRDTALMVAASRGANQVVEFLVGQGANINARGGSGRSALHTCVANNFVMLGEYLIKRGADPSQEDDNGFSALDLAQQWQKDRFLAAEAKSQQRPRGASSSPKLKTQVCQQFLAQRPLAGMAAHPTSSFQQESNIRYPKPAESRDSDPALVGMAEIMRVFMPNKSYKALMVGPSDTASQVCKSFSQRFGEELEACFLQLTEVARGSRRRLDGSAVVFRVRSKWPTILSDNPDDPRYFFEISLTFDAPEDVKLKFRKFMYGR